MQTLVLALAWLGALGLVARLLRTLARVALRTAEVASASSLTEVSRSRGDLTGMVERRAAERTARRARRLDALLAALWLVWLVIPPAAGFARDAFAIAAPLWLLPMPKVRVGVRKGDEAKR